MIRTLVSLNACAPIAAVLCFLGSLTSFRADAADGADSADTSAAIEFFERKIRPVLVERCYKCHSTEAGKAEGGLLLDSRDAIRKGGESGAAVTPNKPDESLLLEAIRYESLEMPPDAKLSAEVVAHFETWIGQGAADPREATAASHPATEKNEAIDFAAAQEFWAFRAPQSHAAPVVSQTDWPRGKIDHFTLAAMEREGFAPAVAAQRPLLARRVFYDLVGLPPTPAELANFLDDDSDSAYDALVDRLLNSPHFGEKWARLWLDVARFAEDQAHIVGNNKSLFFPNAYLYRDWLINSLNQDLPYDEFIRRQLAADQMDRADQQSLGFIGLGPKYYRRNDPEVMADEWEDRVDTLSRGLLGLTVACARCHDHKYDPIATEDYYALAGVFASTQMYNRPLPANIAAKAKPEQAEGKQGGKGQKNKKAKDDKSKLPEATMHVVRDGKVANIKVHIRGNAKKLGDEVPRGFLQVLSANQGRQAFRTGSGRLELAEAIVDRNNPLTARVIVNRVWGQLFGQHLVATPSNFGRLGERPTHPELLDDLAVRFMEEGWSLKRLVREIVLSATYRQSSLAAPTALQRDPDNRYLSRMNRRRLTVEQWRDGVLLAAGRLSRKVGGKSIDVDDPEETRRTIYTKVSRFELNPMLSMFDFPDPNVHAAQRVQTTTALQRLFHMNSPFTTSQASKLSERVLQHSENFNERLEFAYRLVYSRSPSSEESAWAREFLATGDAAKQWHQFTQLLLISNEMIYID